MAPSFPSATQPSTRSSSGIRLDLNLFRVFDAVYEHGGISGAARHLHLSQPAVSHALARLRRQWNDPLFVRRGNGMVPTELSRRVIGEVRTHLRGLHACLAKAGRFDPLTLDMTLRLGMRDALEAITLPPLVARLAQLAPGVRLASVRVPHDMLERALTEGEVDLIIDRQRRVGGRIQRAPLVRETLAVLSRPNHPWLDNDQDVSGYFAFKHVLVTTRPDQEDPLRPVWATLGLGERDIALRCQHYFAAAKVVAHSDLLLTLPRIYARELTAVLPLALRPLPVPLPPLAIWMYWHADRDHDPAHAWIRQSVAAGAQQAMQDMNDL